MKLNIKKLRATIIAVIAPALLAAGALYWSLQNAPTATASWWNDSWLYRQAITITNNTSAQTNVYVSLTIDTDTASTSMQVDCGDFRFVSAQGEVLDYYIESGCRSTSTVLLIAMPTFPAGAQTIYFYYGNPSAENGFVSAQSGAVSMANAKLSLVNGTSFVDFSTAGILTGNPNKKLKITDSAGKKLIGYIKAAGTGETYGTEQITNGDFSSASGWGTVAGTAISGGVCTFTNVNADGIYRTPTGTMSPGMLFRASIDVNDISQGLLQFLFYGGSSYSMTSGTGAKIRYRTLLASGGYSYNYIYTATSPATAEIDNFSMKQVLTPSATGVTITNTSSGSIYNWLSEEDGFNRNSASYTYTIYPLAFATEASNYAIGTVQSAETGPGPVGYWSFDEGYGATAHDESFYKNDGTITGAAWRPGSECVSGNCLYFDGNEDYISVAQNASLQATGKIAIEAWVKWQGMSDTYLHRIAQNGDKDYLLGVYGENATYSNKVIFGINGVDAAGEMILSDSALSKNIWHHIAGIYDRTLGNENLKLYIDGILQNETADKTDYLNQSAGGLKISNTGTTVFKGFLDELKIYPNARSADQIRQDYAAGLAGQSSGQGADAAFGSKSDSWLTDGLVGYWKMDETSGTIVADSSGNGNNGTLTNAQETGTSDASGNTTTTLIDSDSNLLSTTTEQAYKGMILVITSACGSITAGTQRLISDYASSTKTFTVSTAWANAPDSCPYEIRHQMGGKYGSGLGLSGDNDYIITESLDTKEGDFGLTVSVWGNKTKNAYYSESLVSQGGGNWAPYYVWQLAFNTGNRLMCKASWWTGDGGDGMITIVSDVQAIILHQWQHLVCVFKYDSNKDTTSAQAYIDGKIVASLTLSGKRLKNSTDRPFVIGATTWSAYPANPPNNIYAGRADEARIYNRALSPDEVRKLYEWAPGPVGHWKMDEYVSGDAKTIYDSSGGGNNGTTYIGLNGIGMDCSVPGKFGSACKFDGLDDYISISDPNNIAGTDHFTVGLWLKTEDNTGAFLTKWNTYYQMLISNSLPYVRIIPEGYPTNPMLQVHDTVSINDNKWHHVTEAWDEGNIYLYVDGRLISQASSVSSRILRTTSAVHVGSYVYGVCPENCDLFAGSIDDVRIYNYVRTQKQILEDMHGGPGLYPLAQYDFDEGYSTVVHDGSGNSKDLTLSASAGWTLNGHNGKAYAGADNRRVYDGADDNDLDFATTSDFAVSAWIKYGTTPPAATQYILDKHDDTGFEGYGLYMDSSGRIGFGISDIFSTSFPEDQALSSKSYADNSWHHVLGRKTSNSKIEFFIDGELAASDTSLAANDNLANSATLYIGDANATDGTDEFLGDIDEIKIFNYALSVDEVKTEYNQGSSLAVNSQAGADNSGTAVTGAVTEYCLPGDTAQCGGPVAEWKFDEMSGTTTYDTSGNGNNGSLGSGTDDYRPTWIPSGKHGSALKFDGQNDYVKTLSSPKITSILGNNEPFTWSFWFNPTSLNNSFLLGTGNIISNGIGVNIESEELRYYYLGNSGWEVGSSTISLNTWQFVAVTYDTSNSRISLYLNGLLKAADLVDTGLVDWGGYELNIGASVWETNFFNGKIDEVKIYNYARTPAQIAWEYNKGKPVAHWAFNECQGSTIHDESGNGNHGTLNLGSTGTTATGTCASSSDSFWYNGRTGKYNSAGSFDGADNWVQMTNNSSLKPAYISLSAWIYWSAAADQSIISELNSNGDYTNGYLMRTEGDSGAHKIFCYFGTGSTYTTGMVDITLNEWNHILCVYDGSSRLYVNGVLAAQAISAGPTLDYTGTGDLLIGKRRTSDNNMDFNGLIDEVKIWNYPLTAQQVKEEYNGGSIRFGE